MGRVWMRLSCGVGSLFNECWRQMALSFGLVFYTKVVGLSNSQAGLILAMGQVTSLISTITFGYLCDKVDVPFLSSRLGRKKTWHLFSTVLLAPFLLMAFSRCFPCSNSSSTWVAFAYFICGYSGATFMFGATEMAHLSLISVISESQEEAIILNSLRTGFSFVAGILTYVVALATLSQSSQKELSANNWKEFSITAAVLVSTGLFFSALFHIGTKEKKQERTKRVSTVLMGLNHSSVMMVLGLEIKEPERKESRHKESTSRKPSAVRRISAYFLSSQTSDEDDQEESGNKPPSERKKSRLRKFSDYLMPFDTESIVGPQGCIYECESGDEDSRTSSRKASREHKTTIHSNLDAIMKDRIYEEDEGKEKECNKEEMERDQVTDDTAGKKVSFDNSSAHAEAPDKEKVIGDLFRKEKPKYIRTWKMWLKYRAFYKVAFVYISVRFLENITYSYLALYLVDYLQYPKEAIAYFPLTLFTSAVIGTAVAKRVNQSIGNKWIYLVFSVSTIGGAVWFYSVNESSRDVTYAPTVLIGCGMSGLTVMVLAFVTGMIGKYKESSGFVFAVMTMVLKLLTGAFIVVAQNLYPSDKEGRKAYIRHLFAVSLGIVALLPALVVLFFQQSDMICHCVPRDPPEGTEIQLPNKNGKRDTRL